LTWTSTPQRTPAAQKEANDALAQKFGVEAFPTVVVLNSDGKAIKQRAWATTAKCKDFIAELQKLQK